MVKELEEDRINPFLKKSSDKCALPLTKNSRRRQLIDMNGYKNKAGLEDDE